MAELQHNMWVVAARSAVLSVITVGGKWVEITTHVDPPYLRLIVTAERNSSAGWRAVSSLACSGSSRTKSIPMIPRNARCETGSGQLVHVARRDWLGNRGLFNVRTGITLIRLLV
jgi:hypothetical protein